MRLQRYRGEERGNSIEDVEKGMVSQESLMGYSFKILAPWREIFFLKKRLTEKYDYKKKSGYSVKRRP